MESEGMLQQTEIQSVCMAHADDPLAEYPCGFLRCTYEEFPKVLSVNRYMFRLLGIDEHSDDWRGFIQNNVFFMIPFDERAIFRKYLELAGKSEGPVSIEHSVHNGAGGQTRLVGWVHAVTDQDGVRSYHFVYMEQPHPLFSLQQTREHAYESALKSVYDLIIKLNFAEHTIECVHKANSDRYPYMLGAKVTMGPVIRDEFMEYVSEKDRERLDKFFRQLMNSTQPELPDPLTVRFRKIRGNDPTECLFSATKLDDKTTLLCGRNIFSDAPAASPVNPPSRAALPAEQQADAGKKPRVSIHTFGYFDVFVDGEPVVFRYEKSKEMLAILVDRRGSFVANPYLISCLWEDEPYNEKIQSRCRQTAYRMMETLKQYGIEDIIEKVAGRRRIIPEKVDCDCFNYMQGKQVVGQAFNGAYMSDYSWGETTLSSLTQNNTGTLI